MNSLSAHHTSLARRSFLKAAVLTATALSLFGFAPLTHTMNNTFQEPMTVKLWHTLICVVVVSCLAIEGRGEDSEGITWQIEFNADKLPAQPTWTSIGKVEARLTASGLTLTDRSTEEEGGFRAAWKADPSSEIIVEAKVKVGSMRGTLGAKGLWPWRFGAPIGILVSDGRRQEGLTLTPASIRTFTDRCVEMDTTDAFHVYRLIIRDGDMSVFVDGALKIRGQGAFANAASSPEPFLQFGSNAAVPTGNALWQSIRLGTRKKSTPSPPSSLKVTIGEPWDITRADGVRQTRPFVYHMGEGLLLMSAGQGLDHQFHPRGVLKSTDAGKNWQPIKGLDQKTFAPLEMIRLKSGEILGLSRPVVKYTDPVRIGMSFLLDPQAGRFTMFESKSTVPRDTAPVDGAGSMLFYRHLFQNDDGTLLAVAYDSAQHCYLLKSTDTGETWRHFSTIGKGQEPAVARLSAAEMTAVIRTAGWMPLLQTWSRDSGKTWSEPVVLEEASVDPDLVQMSNGVLACSYGRPSSCVMFSTDQGRTWSSHHLISTEAGYNYTSICEVHPGRLLFVHDAPTLKALYIDVERLDR